MLSRLAVTPKKSVLIDCSYRLSHDHQLRLLVVLDDQMIGHGLATCPSERSLAWTPTRSCTRTRPAPEKRYAPIRFPRARSAPTFIP